MLSNLAIKISDFFSETDSRLFAIQNHSEKKSPPYNSQKPKVNPTKKRKKRLVNRFLKKKIRFEVKIHFETHLYALHPKIGSRYLQKKNKKQLVNRFLKEKNTSFETKLAQECRVKSKLKDLKKEKRNVN